mgnify:CR=1 FL=1
MTDSPSPQGRSPLFALAIFALVINAGALGFFAITIHGQRGELAKLREQSDQLGQTIDLLRMEQTSQYEGHGFHALMDHLTYWAPQLQKISTASNEFYDVVGRVERIVEIGSIGEQFAAEAVVELQLDRPSVAGRDDLAWPQCHADLGERLDVPLGVLLQQCDDPVSGF